jgi:hypothetical protein
MTLLGTNPVTIGNPTKKSDYDLIFNAVNYLNDHSAIPPVRDNFRGLSVQSIPAGLGAGMLVTTTGGTNAPLTGATITSVGSGYTAGDYVLISGTANPNAIFKIPSGTLGIGTAITLVNAGSGYTAGTGVGATSISNSLKFSFIEGVLTTSGNPVFTNPLNSLNAGTQTNITVATTPGVLGGMDITNNANPKASTWYHIWYIFNPATGQGGGFVSLSDGITTGGANPQYPVLPSGYTYMAYIGAIYRTLNNGFSGLTQRGKSAACGKLDLPVLLYGGTTSSSFIALTPAVPSTASGLKIFVVVGANNATSAGAALSLDGVTEWTDLGFSYGVSAGAAYAQTSSQMEMPMNLSQQIYYKLFSGGSLDLFVNGWTFP